MDQFLSPKCAEFLHEFAAKSKWTLPDSIKINISKIEGIPDFTQRSSETQEQVNELKKQEDEYYEI